MEEPAKHYKAPQSDIAGNVLTATRHKQLEEIREQYFTGVARHLAR
jgi:hypothetical protein